MLASPAPKRWSSVTTNLCARSWWSHTLRDKDSFSFCSVSDEQNLCSQPPDRLISRLPQPGTNKLKILVFDKFLPVYNLRVTETIQNAVRLRDCRQYLLPCDWLQNYNWQHCTDMGSSRTFKTFVRWITGNLWSFPVCTVPETIAAHYFKLFNFKGAWCEGW